MLLRMIFLLCGHICQPNHSEDQWPELLGHSCVLLYERLCVFTHILGVSQTLRFGVVGLGWRDDRPRDILTSSHSQRSETRTDAAFGHIRYSGKGFKRSGVQQERYNEDAPEKTHAVCFHWTWGILGTSLFSEEWMFMEPFSENLDHYPLCRFGP